MSTPVQRKFNGTSLSNFTSDDILTYVTGVDRLHNQWKEIPGVDLQAVDKLAKTLKKFHGDAKDVEIAKGIVSIFSDITKSIETTKTVIFLYAIRWTCLT